MRCLRAISDLRLEVTRCLRLVRENTANRLVSLSCCLYGVVKYYSEPVDVTRSLPTIAFLVSKLYNATFTRSTVGSFIGLTTAVAKSF
jgi:hypothetical protein